MTVAEGEVLPAVAVSTTAYRHAVCGYTVTGARALLRYQVESLCGQPVTLPLTGAGEACPDCQARSAPHAVNCECWKLYGPKARLPR